MAINTAAFTVAFVLVAGVGFVSSTWQLDHQIAPRTSLHSDRLSANGVHHGGLVHTDEESSDLADTDIFRTTVQGDGLALVADEEEGEDDEEEDEEEEEEAQAEEESDDNDDSDVPMSLAQLSRPAHGRSRLEMLNLLRSSHSSSLSRPSLSSLSSSSSSSSASSPSISPTITPSSSSRWAEHVPNSRLNALNLAEIEESRQQARARQSELRSQSFRRTILNGLGLERPPSTRINPETRRALLSWLLQRQQTGTSHAQLAERVHVERHCYLGQCTAPMGANSSLWQDLDSHSLRLNFPLPMLSRRRARNQEVERAELTMFIKPRNGCPCLDDNGDQIPGYVVSVHQFTRRLVMRKGRVVHRTSLLGSVRIPFGGNAWLRMDVRRAAQTWMSRPRRNLGLEIRVAHRNGTTVDARSVLGLPECAAIETERSCVHGRRPGVELLPWPQSWHDRHLQVLQGRPYLDLRVADRSRTTVDLAESFGTSPLRLGNLEDFLASE